MVEPVSVSALAIAASVFSIAASVKQLIASRRMSSTEAIEIFKTDAPDAELALLDDPDIYQTISELSIISVRLLRQLEKEANQCELEHVSARDKAETQIDKDRADIQAAQCMCSVLRDLMRYNGSKLPSHGPFQDWWVQYECQL